MQRSLLAVQLEARRRCAAEAPESVRNGCDASPTFSVVGKITSNDGTNIHEAMREVEESSIHMNGRHIFGLQERRSSLLASRTRA